MVTNQSLDECLRQVKEPGLHLFAAGGVHLALTEDRIRAFTTKFWHDPDLLPTAVREAAELRRCPMCPLAGQGGLCDALRPALTFLDEVNRFASYDSVTAIYRSPETDMLRIATPVSVQHALRDVAFLSLISYCQNGQQKFGRYFRGIAPLLETVEIANRLYLNIFWIHHGDRDAVNQAVEVFAREILIATRNQNARMHLLCTNDAFLNAFVAAQVAIELLTINVEDRLRKSFDGGLIGHVEGEPAAQVTHSA